MGGIYKERKAVVVEWEKDDYIGPVSIKTSSADGKPSGTELIGNPGFAALSYPLDHSGTTHVQVFGGDELLDEFDIVV